MWTLIKFIGGLVKVLFWLILVAALACLVILYVLEHDMPAPLVARISSAMSNDGVLCRIDRATFGLRTGLRLYHVKVLPKRVADKALVSADEIDIELSLSSRAPFGIQIRGVTLKNLAMPALPAKRPPNTPPSPPVTIPHIPHLQPFPLTLDNTDILGIKAKRLTATVVLETNRVALTDVDILWPDTSFTMQVRGGVTADFNARQVNGHVAGQAFPENILPLLYALHSHGAIKQIDCFSKLTRPVDASANFDVNIDNSDFSLILGLDVGPCAYRGVPLKFARGTVAAYGTNIYTTVAVQSLQAESATGPLTGNLVYHEETESLDLDATASMDLTQLVTIINILNHGELDRFQCAPPLHVSAKGQIALSSAQSTLANDLHGHLSFNQGSILNLSVKDMNSDFTLSGYQLRFEQIDGLSACGGKLNGQADFSFPDYAATSTVFTTDMRFTDVELADISRALNVTNARAGRVSGHLKLGGQATRQTVASLTGSGAIRIHNGLLHRMRLFAGFTDYLARTVPGVSALVNQSSGSMEFTVNDGILKTENLLIEGDIFSMLGRGTYDLNRDDLAFTVRANFFKEKTFAGRITRFVTMPFTRLLMEFKVFGALDNPDWSYVNILEKVTDTLNPSSAPQQQAPSEN